jgi:septal ring factor EnvC (AmiA/AmiB activator)
MSSLSRAPRRPFPRAARQAHLSDTNSELLATRRRLESELRARQGLDEGRRLETQELAEVRIALTAAKKELGELRESCGDLDATITELRARHDGEGKQLQDALVAKKKAEQELALYKRRHSAEVEARAGMEETQKLYEEELTEVHNRLALANRVRAELEENGHLIEESNAELRRKLQVRGGAAALRRERAGGARGWRECECMRACVRASRLVRR